jgi:low temperature requirement protein LtrA
MRGRDTREEHRVASTLELLYDLTIVVSFSLAGAAFAHATVSGHFLNGLVAFLIAMFAIVWAWLTFTWFSSAYDTDDWGMRLSVLIQMIGVIVLALGLGDLFHGMNEWEFHNTIVVAGYVIMRISMVGLWLRAANADPTRRTDCRRYAAYTLVVQILWIITAMLHMKMSVAAPVIAVMFAMEMLGPRLIEGRQTLTPWHPHHIAERYSLLIIITLGEVNLGTTMAVQSAVDTAGWSWDAGLIALAGVGIAFGLWWTYFAIPFGEVLQHEPSRGWIFGHGHMPLYAATAATGAGLHVAAYFVQGESDLSEGLTILAIGLPLAAWVLLFFFLASRILATSERFHLVLCMATLVTVGVAVALGFTNAPLGLSLIVLALAPWISVIGYETLGHRHLDEAMQRVTSQPVRR